MFNIIILKGEFGTFVDIQKYSGEIPPRTTSIKLDGEVFKLSLYELNDSQYLIAHQHDVTEENRSAVDDAIIQLNIKPVD